MTNNIQQILNQSGLSKSNPILYQIITSLVNQINDLQARVKKLENP